MSTQDRIPRASLLTQDIRDVEDEDIANAIAASLDTPQVTAAYVHSADWTPATEAQRRTRMRQIEALNAAAVHKDTPGLYKALRESLEAAGIGQPVSDAESTGASTDNNKRAQTTSNTTEPPLPRPSGPPKVRNTTKAQFGVELADPPKAPTTFQDILRDMDLEVALRLPPVSDPDGDTYVYIDPPPKQPEQDYDSYNVYRSRFEYPMVMRSFTLYSLNSAVLKKALAPTAQHRVVRRRGLVGQLPPNIKYVLDLTPSTEGDDAAHLLSELYCPDGVRKWSIAGHLWKISNTLIGGQDEYTSTSINATSSGGDLKELGALHGMSDSEEKTQRLRKYQENSMELPLQYSPIRHRSAIVRVLRTVAGLDPGLDSAAKVWTMCAVAKSLEIDSPLLLDYVVSWVYTGQNSNFLEVLPEVSLKIADILKCHNMCRDAFAILVAEEALESLCRNRCGNVATTMHGRKREDVIPESYRTRIEYASKAFIERVNAEFKNLVSMEWLEHIPEFKKLLNLRPVNSISSNFDQCDKTVDLLQTTLKKFYRSGIFRLLCLDWLMDAHNSRDWDYHRTNSLFPSKDQRAVWNALTPRERILTRGFWHSLRSRSVSYGLSNVSFAWASVTHVSPEIPSAAEQQLRDNGVIEVVPRRDLFLLANRVEALRTALTSHDDEMHLSNSSVMSSQMKNQAFIEWRVDGPCGFDLVRFFSEVETYLQSVANRMLSNVDIDLHKIQLLDILSCLNDTEWKYLPLWAGGCDDESGGVYDDDIPIASASFSHPGPNVHIGPDSSAGSSEFDFISGPATHNTSTMTNNISNSRVSNDVASMLDAIDIHSSAHGSVNDTINRQDHSASGDSEYEFVSATSVNEGPANRQTLPFRGIGDKMSDKAQGKQVMGDNKYETVEEWIKRNEREQDAQEENEKVGRKKAIEADDEDWFEDDTDSDDTIGGRQDSDEDEDFL